MHWKHLKIIATFLVVLVLSGCGDDPCIRECDADGSNCKRECGAGNCVDADDWGFAKVKVSAEQSNLRVRGSVLAQYAEPIDSGQIIVDADNIPLIITVGKRDQWSSWFGGQINPRRSGAPDPDGFDGGRSVPDRECIYYLTNPPSGSAVGPILSSVASPPSGRTFATDVSPQTLKLNKDVTNCPAAPQPLPASQTDSYVDCKVPCYFRNGMGLYVGVAPDNGNASRGSDVVLSYHIPDAKNPEVVYDRSSSASHADKLAAQGKDGYLVRGLAKDELPGAQSRDRLYFKIVDRSYIDNSGGYTVKLKEGTRGAEAGPLEKISGIFLDPLRILMNRIYNGIVSNTTFINLVRACLVLYMAFYGYTFLIGGVEEAKKDVIKRLFKFGIVVQLISPNSWDFFYNHLFSVFVNGIQQIAGLLMNPFGDFDPNSPWYSMDRVLQKLFSSETTAKIWSTFFSNSLGFLYVPTIMMAIFLFLWAVIQALITYLLAFAGIALLVALAPLFILFMLFGHTAKLTKEWFDQLVVYSIQQILLMAALGMFAALIVTYLERTVGYNVCWNVYWNFGVQSIEVGKFKFWMPDISTDQANIWMDANGDGIRESNPPEMAYRYIDFPYLDPVYDKAEIAKILTERNFISIQDILILLAAIFLMQRFMSVVPNIAQTLKGGAAKDSSNIFQAGENLTKALTSAAGDGFSALKRGAENVGSRASKFAASREARVITGGLKRRGAAAASKVAGAAKSFVNELEKPGLAAKAMKAQATLNEARKASDAQKAMAAAANAAGKPVSAPGHRASDIKVSDIGGTKQLYSTDIKGLDATNKGIRQTVEGASKDWKELKTGGGFNDVFSANLKGYLNDIKNAGINGLSGADEARKAGNVLSMLNNPAIGRKDLQGIKINSYVEKALREQLQSAQANGLLKPSEAAALNKKLDFLAGDDKALKLKPAVRAGIKGGVEEGARILDVAKPSVSTLDQLEKEKEEARKPSAPEKDDAAEKQKAREEAEKKQREDAERAAEKDMRDKLQAQSDDAKAAADERERKAAEKRAAEADKATKLAHIATEKQKVENKIAELRSEKDKLAGKPDSDTEIARLEAEIGILDKEVNRLDGQARVEENKS